MRVLRPAANVLAFYDGRVEGYRFAAEENWVDIGALSLGIASYAVIGGDHALVYDTHVTLEHARRVRDVLEAEGVRRFTVVLSHWHLDHVAGTAVFEDSEIVACERTAELLAEHRTRIERGELEGPPAIDPLVLPTRTYAGRDRLAIGDLEVELIHTDIHSDDATLLWLPGQRTLLCGDTMEDTVTYVTEPHKLDVHLANLDALRRLAPERILPCHGHPDVIAAGGYTDGLIAATEQYLRVLGRLPHERALADVPLRELIAAPLAEGSIHYFAPYEAVHRENVEATLTPL
jgi:cyclase